MTSFNLIIPELNGFITLIGGEKYKGLIIALFIKCTSAAIVMFLTTICTGLILVLTPDKSVYLDINNKGWHYVFYVVSTISVRLFAGRLSDKIGRRQTLIIGISFLIMSMLMTGNEKPSFGIRQFCSFLVSQQE